MSKIKFLFLGLTLLSLSAFAATNEDSNADITEGEKAEAAKAEKAAKAAERGETADDAKDEE